MKQFLIKNWLWLVAIGILLFFLMEKSQESNEKDEILDTITQGYEEDKKAHDIVIDSISNVLKSEEERAREIDVRYENLEEELIELRNEKIENINAVPSLNDNELDSILTNYRHK